MTKTTDTIGVLLAGGGSTRFGSPKWAAEIGGRRLIDRVLTTLGDVFDEVVLVTRDPSPFAGLGLPLIPDTPGAVGPLAGIHAALTHAAGRSVALAPCDAPFVTPEYYRLLLERSDNTDAVFPTSEGRPGFEPLFGWFSPDALAPLTDSLHLQGGAVHRFVASLPRVRYLQPEELARLERSDHLFMNVNTMDDLHRADALLRTMNG